MKNRILSLAISLFLMPFGFSESLSVENKALIQKLVDERVNTYLNSNEFQQAIDSGIYRFIETQNTQRVAQEAEAKASQAEAILPVNENDYVYGNLDARYTLIEYSDYECPYCKKFHSTAEMFVERNPEVNWVYRHFPLDFHNPGAQKQAEAAECAGELAGNQGFWDYSKKIFERTKSNGKGFPIENLVPLAEELKLNKTQFETCLNTDKYRNKVLLQFQQGQRAGVTGTPGNFLIDTQTGQIIAVNGAQPLNALESALNKLKENN